ncbi:hypothetical protein R3P38DRAFT_2550342 [Favolaschia claudopus]|uniref:Uncharacterized protein n=1 Tax=Favolaschia claudopus TaxID=2862362 RepID=A0AAW0AH76_9AGAR
MRTGSFPSKLLVSSAHGSSFSLQQTLIRQGGKKLLRDDLAKRYAAGTPSRTFAHWHSAAKRLLVLCGAGTVYILPIIAAMGMRSKIAGAETAPQDIVSPANALREVKHGQWFTMVQRFMIPINYIRTHPGYIQHLKLIHNPPDSQGQQTPIILSFQDEEKLDTIFDSIETETYRLPPRSKEWMRTVPSWPKIQFADQVVLPRLRKIKTPLQLRKTKSPVTKSNHNQVTERERRYASKAIPVASIKDLEDKVCFLSRARRPLTMFSQVAELGGRADFDPPTS